MVSLKESLPCFLLLKWGGQSASGDQSLRNLMTAILFYILAFVFVAALVGSWVSNLFGLPGNWFIVALAAVWFYFTDAASTYHIGIGLIILLAVLAGIGELIEFGASILGNKKVGGSRRAGFGGLAGSLIGGVVGIFVGLPILNPLLGMVVGTVLFACVGALVGATLGEKSDGAELGQSLKVGSVAAASRLVGTLGKVAFGAAMLVLAILDLFI